MMARIDEIQEIVDLIVDHLVSDIQSTILLGHGPGREYRPIYPISVQLRELKQCSLISKAFASRSQKHLFSTIAIYADAVPMIGTLPEPERTSAHLEPGLDIPSSRAVDNLLSILEQKPHLVKHLHTMTICDLFAYLVRRYESLRKLFGLLRSQGNPRSIEIRGSPSSNSSERSIPPDYGFQEVIGAHLQSLTCRFAKTIPVCFISSNHDLQNLELSYCTPATEIEGQLYPPSRTSLHAKPIRLFTRGSWAVIDRLLSMKSTSQPAIDFSNLIYLQVFTLKYSTTRQDALCFQRLLSTVGPSLQELAMSTYVHHAGPESFSSLDLSSCTRLHTATLLTVTHIGNSSPFDRFIDTLGTIPSSNSIRALSIEVYLILNPQGRPQEHRSLRWDAMDKALHRISNDSAPSSDHAVFNLSIKFQRDVVHRESERTDIIQDCEIFAEDLRTSRFGLMTSNERVKFKIHQTFDVDML